MERSSYCAKASDKPPMKVCKSQELLNLFAAVWCRPFCHSGNFSRVHLHFSRGYDEAQEQDRFGMKNTFLCFDIQVMFYQSLKNLVDMNFVCSEVRRIDQNVIQINIHKMIQKVSQNVIDHGLENCRCTGETKGHHTILIVAAGCVKTGFPLVSLSDMDQVVCVGEWIPIFDGNVVQWTVVNTWSKRPVLIPHKKESCSSG